MPQDKRSSINQTTTTTMDFIDSTFPPPSTDIIKSNNDELSALTLNDNVKYKIQKRKINGQSILCINLSPYVYTDLMVILDDLVQKLLPSSSTKKFAHILFKYFDTALYRGDYYHLAVLRSNRFIGSDIILMAKLKDVQQNFEQLKKLVAKRKRIAKKCTMCGPHNPTRPGSVPI